MDTRHMKPSPQTLERRRSLRRKQVLAAIRFREQIKEIPEREIIRDLPAHYKF